MRPRPILAALCALAACGVPEPPVLPAGIELPPAVRELVDAGSARVREAPRDAARWLVLGETYEANALRELALPCYAEAAELDARDARAPYHRARLLAELGDYEAALASADEALAREPNYGPIHWRRGEWLLALERVDEAQAAFERAASVDPANPAARWGLARVALERGDARRALDELAQLSDAGPTAPYTHHLRAESWRALGESQRAEEEERQAGEPAWIDPWKAEVEEQRGGFHGELERAREAVQRGELEDALARLGRMHAAEPANVSVIGMLSELQIAAGRFDDARALLEDARRLLPEHYRIAFDLAQLDERTGDYERALAELERCTALHPTLAVAHLRRARVLLRLGRPEAALDALASARRSGESGADLERLEGAACARLERWSEAAAAFERASRIPPDAALALRAAEAHARAGEFEAARAALERARGIDPQVEGIARAAALVEEASR